MNEETIPSSPVSADAGTRVEVPASAGEPRREAARRPLPEDALIIVPVRNVVLFPGMVVPLTVGRERSRAAAQEASLAPSSCGATAKEQSRDTLADTRGFGVLSSRLRATVDR